MNETVPKIVITGGPCGGKSSAMPFLYERLRQNGFHPILVPEAPTILMNEGHSPHGGESQLRAFQERVIDLIIAQEEVALGRAVASGHRSPVVVCDRGIMDTKAYAGEEVFTQIVTSRKLDPLHVLTERYFATFHLQSTAIGAEEYYTTVNNSARFETLEEARLADARTMNAWSGHPRFAVITNEGKNFDQKLEILWGHVRKVLVEP